MFAVSPVFTGNVTVDGPNDIMLAGAAAGASPRIWAAGVDANVTLTLQGKGTGPVLIPILDAEGGTIDATTIGATTASTGRFTTLAATTSITAPTAAVSSLLVGQPGRAGRIFDGGAIVENGTYTLIADAPYPLTIVGLNHLAGTTGMSFTANVQNGGASVTGLNAVAVTATAGTATATGNTAVAGGGSVTVTITGAAGSPTGGRLVLRFTRA